ncbi:hypothetical protein DT075_12250 [Bacillus licheniformis]|nr:hypothetical protein DT075_12250 [Bacillus licheniformis]
MTGKGTLDGQGDDEHWWPWKRGTNGQLPNRSFDVTSFGADENGKNDSTEAIQKAIDQAHQAGGGRVTVPEGVFLSGALRLKSNVDLHIAKGATDQKMTF